MVKKTSFSKKMHRFIEFVNYMNKPHIKVLGSVYFLIISVIILSLLLQGYNYSILNIEFIKNFKNNNIYLANSILFIIGYLSILLIVIPLHNIVKLFMWKLPKFTFIIFSVLFVYILYNYREYINLQL